jgi:hypothetical protein
MILVDCARALARGDDLAAVLEAMLGAITAPLEIGSAAVVVPGGSTDELEITASIGLDAAAAVGLSGAMRAPGHPIARTFTSRVATYDVTPMNPGGPALRSHLPLTVRRDGLDAVVGVLALAYDRPIDADMRPVLEAVADLAAVAIERDHRI